MHLYDPRTESSSCRETTPTLVAGQDLGYICKPCVHPDPPSPRIIGLLAHPRNPGSGSGRLASVAPRGPAEAPGSCLSLATVSCHRRRMYQSQSRSDSSQPIPIAGAMTQDRCSRHSPPSFKTDGSPALSVIPSTSWRAAVRMGAYRNHAAVAQTVGKLGGGRISEVHGNGDRHHGVPNEFGAWSSPAN